MTGLPRRLRYILEVVRPGPAEVLHCLELLTRITRHSLQAATEVLMAVKCSDVGSNHYPFLSVQVVHCPRLMDTVFREFLPLMWATQKGLYLYSSLPHCECWDHTGEDGKGAYGVPQPVAVRLVQVICSVSRNLSFLLVSGTHMTSCSWFTPFLSTLVVPPQAFGGHSSLHCATPLRALSPSRPCPFSEYSGSSNWKNVTALWTGYRLAQVGRDAL